MGCRFLLQEIFLTQGSNLHLLHWQAGSLFTEVPSKQCVTVFNYLTILAGRYYLSFTGEEMEAKEIKATSCDRHRDVAPGGLVMLPTFEEQRG